MKFNSPLPQPLPKECSKAAEIFKSFVDHRNDGLDGVIPRQILEAAKGFAILTIFKAGLVFSARAGSGLVVARLEDGGWSAPSAIGTAGMGVGGQLGAEVTDLLLILNSRSAVQSFMTAGSVTLGGNISVAVGPVGRNSEALGSLNTRGQVASMYSYSKCKGLFGGVSIEGSVILERSDTNHTAYNSPVTAHMLLSGVVPFPAWAAELVQTIEACTGMPGGMKWIKEPRPQVYREYSFGAVSSQSNVATSSISRFWGKKPAKAFPPESWGKPKGSGAYFDPPETSGSRDASPNPFRDNDRNSSGSSLDLPASKRKEGNSVDKPARPAPIRQHTAPAAPVPLSKSKSPFNVAAPSQSTYVRAASARSLFGVSEPISKHAGATPARPKSALDPLEIDIAPEALEGIAKAVALFDFKGVEPGDLSFHHGQIITVLEKTESTNDWWKGKLHDRVGSFPANYVEIWTPTASRNPFQ